MEKHNPFKEDLKLLLIKYHTVKAIVRQMVKAQGGEVETYYSTLLRYLIDPNRVNVTFLEHFYTVFQNDFDEIKSNNDRPANMLEHVIVGELWGKDVYELIQFEREQVEDLLKAQDKLLTLYHGTLLDLRKWLHRYHQIVEVLEKVIGDRRGD